MFLVFISSDARHRAAKGNELSKRVKIRPGYTKGKNVI